MWRDPLDELIEELERIVPAKAAKPAKAVKPKPTPAAPKKRVYEEL